MKVLLSVLLLIALVGCGGTPAKLNSIMPNPAGSAGAGAAGTSTNNSGASSSTNSSSTTSSSSSNSSSSSSATNAVTTAGNIIANLQTSPGWTGYALLPPSYGICSGCSPGGPQTTWWSQQGVSSPSLSGSSMQFDIGGQTAYSDALWNNHLIGQFSSQGIPDYSNSINNQAHNFIYDVYFFAQNLSRAQALEFDINQFVNGQSYIWGHECRIAGGNQWDVWDNPHQTWHPTGVGCYPLNNQWNHLTIQVQRTSDGHLLFQTITLNGATATLNRYDTPTSSSWSGITVNYQQDGNQQQQPYSIWLDNVSFHYW